MEPGLGPGNRSESTLAADPPDGAAARRGSPESRPTRQPDSDAPDSAGPRARRPKGPPRSAPSGGGRAEGAGSTRMVRRGVLRPDPGPVGPGPGDDPDPIVARGRVDTDGPPAFPWSGVLRLRALASAAPTRSYPARYCPRPGPGPVRARLAARTR